MNESEIVVKLLNINYGIWSFLILTIGGGFFLLSFLLKTLLFNQKCNGKSVNNFNACG
jgi:hypothetical protein